MSDWVTFHALFGFHSLVSVLLCGIGCLRLLVTPLLDIIWVFYVFRVALNSGWLSWHAFSFCWLSEGVRLVAFTTD